MIIRNGERALTELVTAQIKNMFLLQAAEQGLLKRIIPRALQSAETCFKSIQAKYYRDNNGNVYFNPYHTGQYSIFLFTLSKQAWREAPDSDLANKLYGLNKLLNACDIYYEVEMPSVYYVEHPVGSVLGRATYSNYLVVQQNCTIGGNKDTYPVVGEYVWLHAGATIVGDSRIGDNVFLSAGCYVKDEDVPGNTIVFGTSPRLTFRTKSPEYFYSKSPFSAHRDCASGS